MPVQALQIVTIYTISMFGGFSIQAGDTLINDSINRTHQVWNLLEYLVANRGKAVSQEELIEMLWPDGDSFNPANALKNLVYRIRTILEDYNIPNGRDLICYSRGSYSFNSAVNCTVDCEEFDRLIKLSETGDVSEEEQVDLLSSAIELYKGDFLPGSSYEQWVVPLSGYYRTLYFKALYRLCDFLVQRQRFGDVERICEQAIAVDSFDERAHKYLIYAMVQQGKQTAALQHYNYVTELFYRELGVKPSESLRNLYREITKSVNAVETDLDIIKSDLNEHDVEKGAFYCNYEIFKNMYRLEARAAERSGQSVFIALLTLAKQDNSIPEPKLLAAVMDELLTAIRGNLRLGDIVSRFSSTQYVLMLPTLTLESGQAICSRILRNFRSKQRFADYRVHTMLQPLDTVDEEED